LSNKSVKEKDKESIEEKLCVEALVVMLILVISSQSYDYDALGSERVKLGVRGGD
jgi:hypothetical protein